MPGKGEVRTSRREPWLMSGTDEMFLVQVAEKMGLPPATLPSLIANGWQVSDAGLYDLKSYELQSGSEACSGKGRGKKLPASVIPRQCP